MLSIEHHKLFKHTNRISLYWLFLNCIIFQARICISESVDSTASSLNLDDSIDQSTSTVQNLNQESNSTGGLLSGDQATYYSLPGELLLENETNSNPIVVSNNVSTNKMQQNKPNLTLENRIVESLNNDQFYVSSSPPTSDFQSSPILNSTAKSNKNLPSSTQYEYLNSANSAANKIMTNQPVDDLIEFQLNGSTSFSKFLDKTNSATPSTVNLITQSSFTTSTPISTSTTLPSEPNDDSSLPELYAPLSSFIANSIAHKNVGTTKTIPASQSNESALPEFYSAGSSTSLENRLRWINNYNRNKMPPYPPKQPTIPGIPSGFRSPITTPNTLPPSNNIPLGMPSGMINGVSTPPIMSPGTNSAPYLNPSLSNLINNSGPGSNPSINLASIANSLLSPNNIHQPAGFGGSSLAHSPSVFPYPTANSLIGPPSIFATAAGGGMMHPNLSPEVEAEIEAGLATATHSFSRRPGVNITRVEHIAAECSDDYMKVIINFNGTFTGLVYSSGFVHNQNCIYVNGTGRNGYEFYIRLNQCGTMGREEMHHPKRPGEVRRRDQVMWNTLSIQYNGMIEEEFDEHYRVTCEYGSDYWKTVTFPTFNVEVNTGSPVVFTINPPQCVMEVRRGFGIAGSRTSGPVTVGDPLTLLIHMKSEKAGFDILVKNCISHNGGTQRLQLIDTNGCVTNEKLISPFRGTYNSDDGHQVTLYAYLKAFRFTGSPALYLECDIHMCHNRCPPQRCYWRNLSKRSIRSVSNETDEYGVPFKVGRYNFTIPQTAGGQENGTGVISESLSLFQALEVRHSDDMDEDYEQPLMNKYDHTDSMNSKLAKKRGRKEDALRYLDEFDDYMGDATGHTKFCFTGLNLTFFSVLTITVIISAISTSVLSCLRLRKIRLDHLRYDDRLSAISKSTCSNSSMFYGHRPQFRRY